MKRICAKRESFNDSTIAMGNRRGEAASNQSRRRKSLPVFTAAILFFLSASSIQHVQNLDRQLKAISFDGSNDIVRNGKRVAKRMEGVSRNETSLNASFFSGIVTDETNFENGADSSHLIQIKNDESFLWQGAQSRLCAHIKKERKKLESHKKLQLNLVTRCKSIHERNQHGNFMIGFYAMKVASMAYQADFSFRCLESEQKDYMLWWLQSRDITMAADSKPISTTWTVTPDNEGAHYLVNSSLYTPSQPTPDIACRGMGHVALHYSSEYVRKDMRAMAVELLPSMKSKGMTIDEVAIHLRCGDIISKNLSPKDKNYGLVQFKAYQKNIPRSVQSIGIVTAPFSEENRRKQDLGSGQMCQTLVFELVHYLELHFPKAKVRVRNDPNESIPEVVSRLIMAKHNFCVRSTFCLLPSIAAYGTSYIQKGGAAYFMDDVSKVYDDIQLMDEPFLLTVDIKQRGFNSTLKWLTEI